MLCLKKKQNSKRAWHVLLFSRLFFSVNALFERLRARDSRETRVKNTGSGIKCEQRTRWVSGACSIHQNWYIDKLPFESSQTAASATEWMTWKSWVLPLSNSVTYSIVKKFTALIVIIVFHLGMRHTHTNTLYTPGPIWRRDWCEWYLYLTGASKGELHRFDTWSSV